MSAWVLLIMLGGWQDRAGGSTAIDMPSQAVCEKAREEIAKTPSGYIRSATVCLRREGF